MAIRVNCEGCKKSFAVKDRFAGKTGICPYCGGSIAVPTPEPAEVGALAEGEFAVGGSAVHQSGTRTDSTSSVSLAVATEIPKKACPKCTRLNLAGSLNCFYCGVTFPDAFDPYYKWLGIPRQDQPPHHYRLLGVVLYETDPDVIQEAADQRMAHVRTHQNGPHAVASQRILNELSTAKVCLINADKRAAYDVQLKARLAPVSAKIAPMPVGIPVAVAQPMGAAMPANPMDQFLPPTVWGAPPGYSPPAQVYQPTAYPPGAGAPMAGVPQGYGMPMHGPQHGGPVPMARPVQAPMAAPIPSGAGYARPARRSSGNAGLIQGLIAVVVAGAIMAVGAYFLNK